MAQGYDKPDAIVKPTAAQMKLALGYVPARAPTSSSGGVTIGGSPTQPDISINESLILDAIGSTRGDILFRGAAGWQALAPGAAGDVLQTNGAGADPTWVVPSGGGGGTGLGYIGGPVPQLDPHTSNTSGTGFFVGRLIVAPKATTINSLILPVTASVPTCTVQPAVYGVTAGTWDIAALLKTGPAVTGIVKGVQVLPLASGLALAQGAIIWVGISISGAAISVATTPAAGSVFFTSPAIPPNPAASPTYNGTTAAIWASE